MTDLAAIAAARLRILDELYAEAERAWPNMPAHELTTAMLMLALDRIHRGETRGYGRQKPPQPATLDAGKLQSGLE